MAELKDFFDNTEQWSTRYGDEYLFTCTMLKLMGIPFVVFAPFHSDKPRDSYDFTVWKG